MSNPQTQAEPRQVLVSLQTRAHPALRQSCRRCLDSAHFFFMYSLILELLLGKLRGLDFLQACGWTQAVVFYQMLVSSFAFPAGRTFPVGCRKQFLAEIPRSL